MAIIPTSQMTTAYEIIMNTNKHDVEFGKNKEHKLKYFYDPNTDIDNLLYYHYGTKVLTVKVHNTNGDIEYILHGGFSASDRDNINGILKLNGMSKVKCHLIDECLMFVNENNKSKMCRHFVIDESDNLFFFPDF